MHIWHWTSIPIQLIASNSQQRKRRKTDKLKRSGKIHNIHTWGHSSFSRWVGFLTALSPPKVSPQISSNDQPRAPPPQLKKNSLPKTRKTLAPLLLLATSKWPPLCSLFQMAEKALCSSWIHLSLAASPESSASPRSFRAPQPFFFSRSFHPFSFLSVKLLLVPQKPIWIFNSQSGSDTWLPKSATLGQKLIAKNALDISQFGGLQIERDNN